MVAHLLRLKLTLLRNSLRRSPWQLAGLVIGALHALGIVGLCAGGLLFLRQADISLAQTVVVLGGAAALLGWALVPVAASAAGLTLDPARFTTFAVPVPRLLAGLAPGGLIGVPGRAALLVALAMVGIWSRSLPAAAAALAGAVLGVLSCVVPSRVVTTATAGLAASGRFKDVSAVAFLIPGYWQDPSWPASPMGSRVRAASWPDSPPRCPGHRPGQLGRSPVMSLPAATGPLR